MCLLLLNASDMQPRYRRLLWQYLLVLYVICWSISGDEDKCERHQGVIKRLCHKQCHAESNCVSKKKHCVCDGDCGKSCINKNLRCTRLNRRPLHGSVEVRPYNKFGATATYRCDDGYSLSGNRVRVCQGDENWSGKEPKCILSDAKGQPDCTDPPVIHNARHDGGLRTSFPAGEQLTYACKDGFIAAAKSVRTAWCVGRLWVGPNMSCTHAGCPELTPIEFGTVEIKTPSMIGSRAKYSCSPGYHLAGRSERECLESGTWGGVEPSCEKVACGEPPRMDNAEHDGVKGQVSFPSGRQIQYRCRFGFAPYDGLTPSTKTPRIMCNSDGRWTEAETVCLPVNCGNPGEISNGWRDGFIFKFPSRVIYNCREGYQLIGRATRKCEANGAWSNSIPSCRAVVCPVLDPPEWGYMNGTRFTYGSVLRFSCKRDYRIVGSSERKCMADSTWSGYPAICQEINCGLPEPIYNGYFDGHKTTVNAIIKFRCNVRTTFEGRKFQTVCLKNGQWSDPTPKCWSQCQVPSIGDGSVVGQEAAWVNHGTDVSYRCHDGLELDDPEPIRCINGTWSHRARCLAAPCRASPPKIANGRRIFLGSRHGDRAKYVCLPGYRLRGSVYLDCMYGEWAGANPSCFEINCKNPGPLANGTVYKRGTMGKFEFVSYIKTIRHGTRLTYECNRGFERVGPNGAACVDGTWRPMEKPYCKPSIHMSYLPRWHLYRLFRT